MTSIWSMARTGVLACIIIVAAVSGATARAADTGEPALLRVGVLESGTLHWELATVERLGLAEQRGIRVRTVSLASNDALKIALQGGEVDLIMEDWLWVAVLRARGKDYQFVPHSRAVGAIMVNPAAGIRTVADLKGRKVGVAGGALDKSWLIARAYARQKYGLDLFSSTTPQFAAPPLISRLLLDDRLPAGINFWHFNVRLAAQGMQELLGVQDMLLGLGLETAPPMLGWVFSRPWAQANRDTLLSFLAATQQAREILATTADAWPPIANLVRPENDAVLASIRTHYAEGLVTRFGPPEIEAAGQLFQILARESDGQLTEGVQALPPDTFWNEFHLP